MKAFSVCGCFCWISGIVGEGEMGLLGYGGEGEEGFWFERYGAVFFYTDEQSVDMYVANMHAARTFVSSSTTVFPYQNRLIP